MRQTQKAFAFGEFTTSLPASLPGFGTLRAPRFAQSVSSVRIDSGLPDSPTPPPKKRSEDFFLSLMLWA
jgi:hypothetical protein